MLSSASQRRTSVLCIPIFVWAFSGGPAYAEVELARRDPARSLERLAANPNVPMTTEQRQQLRLAAQRARKRPDPTRRRCPEGCAKRRAARSMAGLAERLRAIPGVEGGAIDWTAAASDIAAVRSELVGLDVVLTQEFGATRARLGSLGLTESAQARQRAAEASYHAAMFSLTQKLDVAERSRAPEAREQALRSAIEKLESVRVDRRHQPLDVSKLPFRRAGRITRSPTQSYDAAETAVTSGATSPFVFMAASGPPGPGDLAANEDVQITPEIQALATSLGGNPIEIFEWVRNNIDFYPTFGSVQGSQLTLTMKRGNAWDTASLLLALLRSAGVPSRYVRGTVEIPVDDVMNWVGGAPSASVAQQLLGVGGIANTGIIEGSVVTRIQLEHVWVEAFIDFVPSRGAVQVESDSWVPMDASFKLHAFAPASGLETAVPLDIASLRSDLLTGASVDPVLGRIVDIDEQQISPAMTQYVDQAVVYTSANDVDINAPDEVLGSSSIIPETRPFFAGSLPYEVISSAASESTIPAAFRSYVTIDGFDTALDRTLGFTSFTHRISLPAVNSQRLGLTYDPATQADADALAAIRAGGGSSIPLAAINVRPVLKLDDLELTSGSAVGMGVDQFVDVTLEEPGRVSTVSFDLVAGDESVFGMTGNGYNQAVLDARFAAHPVDNAAEYLQQVQLNYWAESDYFNELSSRTMEVFMVRLPSVGLFSSPMSVTTLFGQPDSGVYNSRFMDVKHQLLGLASEVPSDSVLFLKHAGLAGSYLEGQTFDQFEDREVELGGSAIHLIADAALVGIPVYEITTANSAAVLPLLSLDAGVEADISSAVASGMRVLTPESNVDRGPWSGVGYFVIDDATGDGAYLISGGLNGGIIADCLEELEPVFTVILVLVIIALLIYLLWPILAGLLAGAGLAEGLVAALTALRFLKFAF